MLKEQRRTAGKEEDIGKEKSIEKEEEKKVVQNGQHHFENSKIEILMYQTFFISSVFCNIPRERTLAWFG